MCDGECMLGEGLLCFEKAWNLGAFSAKVSKVFLYPNQR